MASNLRSVFSEAERPCCPICLDVYTAPRNLPCLHSYCQHCLHKYIVKNVTKGNTTATFSCPECRKETFPPLPDIPVDKWAEHYPYNTVLLSVLPPENMKVDKTCDSCMCEDSSVTATSYCTVCKEALCLTCEKVHRKNKATRDHAVVNVQDLITNLELAVNLSVSVTCSQHVGKEFEFYCKSHGSMCCSECFYKGHIGCSEVLKIKDISSKILQEKEAVAVMDRLKELKSHLDQFRNENHGAFSKIEAEVNNFPDEIEVVRKKINTLLDNAKAKITMETNALLKEEAMIRHEENQRCESISSAISNSFHLLETVLAHGSPRHFLTTLHKIEEHLVHYESAVKEKYCEIRHVDAKFCLDDCLLSLVKCNETVIAKIDIVENKHSLAPSILPHTIVKKVNTTTTRHDRPDAKTKTVEERNPPEQSLHSKYLKDCKPEIIAQFSADYPDGKYPRYSGITRLLDDKIILMDCNISTCRLYDSSFHHLADYKMTSSPLGVCVVEGSQVAVTLPQQKMIQFLTVDSSIHPGRIINTSQGCDGIAALSGNQLVVSCIRNDSLCWCIVSMDGLEKFCVEVCPSSWRSQLSVNNRRTHIYVSYYNPGAMYAYSVNGTRIFKYKHKTLDGACGVAVDREDNLYVVGQMSNNIHQVSPDGTPLQVFSTGIPKHPSAICFFSIGDEFLLTEESDGKLAHKFKLK
ncbi:hypothetical protein CHS0354_001685 [Potamilus streckersoni]|uniref:Uncharacterized protein n=1 Tax=Potamilus streckersoni TaxID=2493646 RepID=A0AAE0S0D6_9BIVA|nr:hypothetical protein CHS0354_001685 [Potamilus streckersoni]